MGKLGVLIWRKLFESGDEKRLKKQEQDLSDLVITRDLPYIDDGERDTSLTSTVCPPRTRTRRF